MEDDTAFEHIFIMDGSSGESYKRMIIELREKLQYRVSSYGISVLQKNPRPIYFDVVLRTEEVSVSFRCKQDDVYLVGYKTINDQWFEFRSEERAIIGSTFLPFNATYQGMMGASTLELWETRISYHDIRKAVRALGNDEQGEIKGQNLMVVVFTICEAIRFVKISDHVSASYLSTTYPKVGKEYVDLVHQWGKLSSLLLSMEERKDQKVLSPMKVDLRLKSMRQVGGGGRWFARSHKK